MPGFGTTDTPVVFVFASVPGHLTDCAAGAKDCATEVLTATTVLFRNGILPADTLAGFAETVDGPQSKEGAANHLHHSNGSGGRFRCVVHGSNLHGRREHGVGSQEEDHHLESVLGRYLWPGLSEPRQRHASHDLCHGDLVAPTGAAEGRVADSERETVAEAVLPPSGGCLEAIASGSCGKGCVKGLALHDSASWNFASKWTTLVVVEVGFKGVTLWESGWCCDANHHGLQFFAAGIFVIR
mmetsp:Transcript_23691/g.65770  ORF Transcript_23691/g.65770 Transcript_23691/m.65770 type:complete len:241 (-) Transcript_23691:247-969(-)